MPKLNDTTKLRIELAEGQSFREGTTKQLLLEKALEIQEFTKAEFIQFASELFEEKELTSKIQKDKGTTAWAKAWFNEFFNKHEIFKPIENEQTAQ